MRYSLLGEKQMNLYGLLESIIYGVQKFGRVGVHFKCGLDEITKFQIQSILRNTKYDLIFMDDALIVIGPKTSSLEKEFIRYFRAGIRK